MQGRTFGALAAAVLATTCLATAPAGASTQPPVAGTTTPPSAQRVIAWALTHVSWWRGKYSMRYRLPTAKSVGYMQTHRPPRTRQQGCDCSSFARWAMAQAGVDIGTYTVNMWTARGALPSNHRSAEAQTAYGLVVRGYHRNPRGGYKVGDLIFYGSTTVGGGAGHVVIYMGGGRIVQCSGGRGSNAGLTVRQEGTPTGYVRYTAVTG